MISGSGGRGLSSKTLSKLLRSRGLRSSPDNIENVGNHQIFAARSRTPADYNQLSTWLGSTPDMSLHFCESVNGVTTWSQNLQIVEQICADWADIDCRHEWAFPMCSTTESLADTDSGKYDDIIRAMFKKIAEFDKHHVVPVRIGWEANNPTAYPWSFSAAGASIPLYISVYQRIVNIAKKVSSRFRFGWILIASTLGTDGQVVNPEPAYPGDNYVDYIGMDFYYDAGAELGSGTHIQRFVGKLNANYGPVWLAAFAESKGKPIAFPEWGINADAPDYIDAMASWLRKQNLFYAGYFNVNVNQGQFRNQLSNDQYPEASVAFKRNYGPLTILTPSTFNGSTGSSFSAKLEANKRVNWSFVGAYGPFSILPTGATTLLTAGTQTAGTRSVRIRATDERGQTVEKTLTITFAANALQPETQFYINRSSNVTATAYANTLNTLVSGIKSNNLWDMFDGFYIYSDFNTGLAACDLISLRRTGTLVGSTTFASKLGVRSDGSTGYFDTKFQPNMPSNRLNKDDMHWGIWSLTNLARTGSNTDAFEFGAGVSVSAARISNGNVIGRTAMETTVTLAGVPFPGHVMGVRDSSTSERSYRRGVLARSSTTTSATLPYETFKVLAARPQDGQFGANDIALAHFGRGVGWTDEKVTAFHTLLDNFRNSVNSL